jgi:hypothetical protein
LRQFLIFAAALGLGFALPLSAQAADPADCALLSRLSDAAQSGFRDQPTAAARAAGLSGMSIGHEAGRPVWRAVLTGFAQGRDSAAVDRRVEGFVAAIQHCLPGARQTARGEADGLAWRVFALPGGGRIEILRESGTPSLPAHGAFVSVTAGIALARR